MCAPSEWRAKAISCCWAWTRICGVPTGPIGSRPDPSLGWAPIRSRAIGSAGATGLVAGPRNTYSLRSYNAQGACTCPASSCRRRVFQLQTAFRACYLSQSNLAWGLGRGRDAERGREHSRGPSARSTHAGQLMGLFRRSLRFIDGPRTLRGECLRATDIVALRFFLHRTCTSS